jgi:hypothetical protein
LRGCIEAAHFSGFFGPGKAILVPGTTLRAGEEIRHAGFANWQAYGVSSSTCAPVREQVFCDNKQQGVDGEEDQHAKARFNCEDFARFSFAPLPRAPWRSRNRPSH